LSQTIGIHAASAPRVLVVPCAAPGDMSRSGSSGGDPPFGGLKVLVVEDETVVSLVIDEMLKALGCSVVWHASGVNDALAILRRRRPDVGLLDVYLAGELAYPIARWLDSEKVPFVLTTGYGRRHILDHWAGRPIIQKPHTLAKLRAKLELALGRVPTTAPEA
jgi:CheY-like chemotaxis protein